MHIVDFSFVEFITSRVKLNILLHVFYFLTFKMLLSNLARKSTMYAKN